VTTLIVLLHIPIEVKELLRNITLAPCWSLTCVGKLVFNLNSGWVSSLEIWTPSIISVTLDKKSFSFLIGRALHIVQLI